MANECALEKREKMSGMSKGKYLWGFLHGDQTEVLGRTESREGRTHMQAEPWNEGFRGKGATWGKKTQVGRDKVSQSRC